MASIEKFVANHTSNFVLAVNFFFCFPNALNCVRIKNARALWFVCYRSSKDTQKRKKIKRKNERTRCPQQTANTQATISTCLLSWCVSLFITFKCCSMDKRRRLKIKRKRMSDRTMVERVRERTNEQKKKWRKRNTMGKRNIQRKNVYCIENHINQGHSKKYCFIMIYMFEIFHGLRKQLFIHSFAQFGRCAVLFFTHSLCFVPFLSVAINNRHHNMCLNNMGGSIYITQSTT